MGSTTTGSRFSGNDNISFKNPVSAGVYVSVPNPSYSAARTTYVMDIQVDSSQYGLSVSPATIIRAGASARNS